jgi:hypothetical protein
MGHALKYSYQKSGCFTRAGLGLHKHVAPLKRMDERLGLHGHAVRKTGLDYTLKQLFVKLKCGELQTVVSFQ